MHLEKKEGAGGGWVTEVSEGSEGVLEGMQINSLVSANYDEIIETLSADREEAFIADEHRERVMQGGQATTSHLTQPLFSLVRQCLLFSMGMLLGVVIIQVRSGKWNETDV